MTMAQASACTPSVLSTAIFGNGCGHSPHAPQFFVAPLHHKTPPDPIPKLSNSLQHYYTHPQKWLKYLAVERRMKRKGQTRSERREAIARVGQTILHYLDLVSLKVGIPSNDGRTLLPLTLSFIAERAKIGYKRAQRALADLIRVGYIQSTQRAKKGVTGLYTAVAAIRSVSSKFFNHLGVGAVFLKHHRKRIEKRRKREAEKNAQPSESMRDMIASINQHGAKAHYKQIAIEKKARLARTAEDAAKEERSREISNKAVMLMKERPELTIDQIKTMLNWTPSQSP
jgi:hypothetical protein